jgi:hypothetical protein
MKDESFNNTQVIKIRNTQNGLHITFRSDSNNDCICEHVIENCDDELEYTMKVLHTISDLLNLEFRDRSSGKQIKLEVVEEIQDCD